MLVQVPRQNNSWDCGLFVLRYISAFFTEFLNKDPLAVRFVPTVRPCALGHGTVSWGWRMYAGRVCARTERTGAAARESLRRDRRGGLTSPAFHTCGSASPFRARCCRESRNRTPTTPTISESEQHAKYTCCDKACMKCQSRASHAAGAASKLLSTCALRISAAACLEHSDMKPTVWYPCAGSCVAVPVLLAQHTAICYRGVPKFSPYGSVCCACAQRPGLPRACYSGKLAALTLQAVLSAHVAFASSARLCQSFSRTLRSQKT